VYLEVVVHGKDRLIPTKQWLVDIGRNQILLIMRHTF